MDATEIAMMKRLLENQLRSLCPAELPLEESGSIESADDNDRASREEERSFSLHLATRKSAQAAGIREALRKLEVGAFGVCELCEEPIGLRRLLVTPTSSLCVKCKEEEEARQTHSLNRTEVA